MHRSIRKGIILAHRYSLSFLPISKTISKEMLPVLDKPIIQWLVEELIEAGIEQILIITGSQKELIDRHFQRHAEWEERLSEQKLYKRLEQLKKLERLDLQVIRYNEAREQIHPLLEVRSWLEEEAFILIEAEHLFRPQTPYTTACEQLMQQHAEWGCSVIGVQAYTDEQANEGMYIQTQQSILSPGESLPIQEIGPQTEEPLWLPSGRYLLSFEMMEHLQNATSSLSLLDLLKRIHKQLPMLAYHLHGHHYPLYSPADLLKANVQFAQQDPLYREQVAGWLLTSEN